MTDRGVPNVALGTLSVPNATLGTPHENLAARPFAWLPVGLVAACFAGFALVLNVRFGYYSDELYFMAAGQDLASGYADQGVALPLIASAMQSIAPDSALVLRVPALLATVGYIVLAAATTRELGGGRAAQTCVAAACALAPHFVESAHLLVTYSFDQLFWAVIIWLLLRWVRADAQGRSGDFLLFGAGAVTALAVLVKLLVATLWLVLIPVALLVGPRRLIARPGLWAGGGLAVLAAVPNLLWQAGHEWPQLEMADVVAEETGASFLPVMLIQVGPAAAVLTVLGMGALLFLPRLRAYRFIGVTAVGLIVLFAATGGRAYYMAGFYAVLLAAAAVLAQSWWQRRDSRDLLRRGSIATVAFACFAWSAVFATERIPEIFLRASVGWQPITAAVTERYHALPGGNEGTAVITHDYWTASALRHFGPERGLPEAYSPSRGFWYLGRPSDSVRRVVYLGSNRERLSRLFGSVRKIGTIHTDLSVPTYFEGTPIFLAGQPRHPWPAMWQRLRHMSL